MCPEDRMRTVLVNDRMQQGYSYVLTAPEGMDFDPAFTPELSPPQMLELGVFCGKYMTDCGEEFPQSRACAPGSTRQAVRMAQIAFPAMLILIIG